MLTLFYHPIYSQGIDPKARFPRERYRLLAERLQEVTSIELISPRQITRDELVNAHQEDYVDRFLHGQLSEKEVRRIGLRPWTDDIVARTLILMGGSLQATEYALETGNICGNLAGGTHHAHYDFGSGYCIFNDLAICAIHALQRSDVNRVLILDCDVHQGDGTASMLAGRSQLITCSIHCSKNFPFRKQVSDLDIALPPEAGDSEYLAAVEMALEKYPLSEFDLVLFQAGVDALIDDRLGHLTVSREGMKQRNQRVLSEAVSAAVPTVILMGGGYAEPIKPTVDAFFDLFTTAADYVSG